MTTDPLFFARLMLSCPCSQQSDVPLQIANELIRLNEVNESLLVALNEALKGNKGFPLRK